MKAQERNALSRILRIDPRKTGRPNSKYALEDIPKVIK